MAEVELAFHICYYSPNKGIFVRNAYTIRWVAIKVISRMKEDEFLLV